MLGDSRAARAPIMAQIDGAGLSKQRLIRVHQATPPTVQLASLASLASLELASSAAVPRRLQGYLYRRCCRIERCHRVQPRQDVI